jgi:hypothetical protein
MPQVSRLSRGIQGDGMEYEYGQLNRVTGAMDLTTKQNPVPNGDFQTR